MANYLVVVESPAKAKTIRKYLGPDYTVRASLGHVKDLPKRKLGVDVAHDFEPEYEVIRGKQPLLKELRTAARKADKVFLATDPDREGEASAFHLAEELGGPRSPKIGRVLFHEITQRAVQQAVRNPLPLDANKFDSQQARRVLDRLVGYRISPLLWDKIRKGLSAGRVQSVAVRLIVEREDEIRQFVPREYWTLDALLAAKLPPKFKARLLRLDGKKPELKDEAAAKAVEAELAKAEYVVDKVDRRQRMRPPPPPYNTSRLQQDAANRLKLDAKKTMKLAQQLYEGVELGPAGSVGLITYMRTDSTRLSKEAVDAARDYIEQTFGREHLPPAPNEYKSKAAAQDAHEAIRPTSMEHTPDKVKPYLDRDLFRLYKLIWERFVCSQMKPAVYDQVVLDVRAGRGIFRAIGSRLAFPGFLAAPGEGAQTAEEKPRQGEGKDDIGAQNKELPQVAPGERLKLEKLLSEQHFTEPPPRYTEATLIKELEEKGIGRPSTYAAIIANIQDREYVKKLEAKFHPTELGTLVTRELVKAFPTELDVQFTASLEGRLDKIEEGQARWTEVLREFYASFDAALAKAHRTMADYRDAAGPGTPKVKCPKCGRSMRRVKGRNGDFLSCSGFPECKSTRNLDAAQTSGSTEAPLDENAPKCHACGKPMRQREGKFGPFLSCTGYPECKAARPVPMGIPCPGCGKGSLAERRSKTGKTFYGCDHYPECRYVCWDKPIAETCPRCNAPFIVEREWAGARWIGCSTTTCDYRRNAPSAVG